MSDFASLLSDLKKTASNKRKIWNSPNNSAATSMKPEKRGTDDFSNNSTNSKRNKRDLSSQQRYCSRPPRDISELNISLTFLCIGAQKAGTTWLDEMLRKIPGVTLPSQQKELHFWDWHRSKGLGWYSRQWNSGAAQEPPHHASSSSNVPLYYGEVTPCYAVLPDRDVCEIHTLFPKVRLVFMARDLVDRVWSAMLMELRNSMLGLQAGQFQEPSQPNNNQSNRTNSTTSQRTAPRILQQLERDADPDKYDDEFFMNRLRHSTHASRSDYATSLRRWLAHFPKEQLLIVRYQQLVDDPRQLLYQCLEHVGVANAKALLDELDDSDIMKRINVGVIAKPPRPSLRVKMERFLQPYARDFNTLLRELGHNDWSLDEYDRIK